MSQSEIKINRLPVAVFITPHGFGHAARAAGVMIELTRLLPNIIFHLYTQVPAWFFVESHLTNFLYHDVLTDIGLAQHNALEEDLPGTIDRLENFLPFHSDLIDKLALDVQSNGCSLVICDIAPIGIAVAKKAGVLSILQENFTWDWIYAGYPAYQDQFAPYIQYLAGLFSQADFHIQTMPVSKLEQRFILVNPVSRPIRQSRQAIRKRLMIDMKKPTILVTMGGIESNSENFVGYKSLQDVNFVIPGAASLSIIDDNLILLPHHHGIYHPDLVNACDAVVGKLGYSTLAECYAAGVPFGFIPRKQFPESAALMKFVVSEMQGVKISEDEFASYGWLKKIQALLEQPRDNCSRTNGACEIAGFIRDLMVTG